jgi:tetratricopeptide (TPR) repeat protein
LLIRQTNVKAVQADMIFKRAQPFDQQANQSQDPLMWDIAIAIYNKALELEPSEDDYYLFLGRALLERSGLSENLGEKQALLAEAQERLLEARDLNPLNTDHSANLARLSTRWAATTEDPAAREERLVMAETYYQEALELSPHNSLIRNELARLEFDLRRNCDLAIAIFRQSLENDPFFSETYFTFSDVLVACAAAQDDVSVRNELYDSALQTIDGGLSLDPEQTRAWIQAGQINYQLSRYDEALAAFEQARTLNEANDLPTWNVDYLRARVFRDMGNVPAALALAQQALLSAPADVADDIQAFVDEIEQLQE